MVPSQQPPSEGRETLQLGPRRTALVDRLPPAARRHAGLVVAAAVGVACGAGATSWWGERQQTGPADAPVPPAASTRGATTAEVRLVMTGVRPASARRGGQSDGRVGAVVADAALLHDRGDGPATVTRIGRPGRAIRIRSRELPLTLSVNQSLVRIRLRIVPRDCALATQWTPSSQPFVLTWEDARGEVHTDLGGDHDAAWEIAMTSVLDAVCARP